MVRAFTSVAGTTVQIYVFFSFSKLNIIKYNHKTKLAVTELKRREKTNQANICRSWFCTGGLLCVWDGRCWGGGGGGSIHALAFHLEARDWEEEVVMEGGEGLKCNSADTDSGGGGVTRILWTVGGKE